MTLRSDITVCEDGSVERFSDGILEHKHEDYDYWHPRSRVHGLPSHIKQMHDRFDHTRAVWSISENDVNDIVAVLSGIQHSYIDEDGVCAKLDNDIDHISTLEPMSQEWVIETSKLIRVSATYAYGNILRINIADAVEVRADSAYYKKGTGIHDAKILLESGIAMMYVPYPDIEDATHILHVSGDGRYYDLIRLPSGGHIPVDILEGAYAVSWETMASIPRGKPRDHNTFTCERCGEQSYYAGICDECADICTDIEQAEINHIRTERKEREHEEIMRLINSGNWEQCRYMRGD